MSFTEVGQTTFSCKCHSLLGSSQTPRADAENTMNCLRSSLESVPKSRLAHGTISFATTREQACLEPATTRLHKHMPGHFITNSPSQAERSPGKDIFFTLATRYIGSTHESMAASRTQAQDFQLQQHKLLPPKPK